MHRKPISAPKIDLSSNDKRLLLLLEKLLDEASVVQGNIENAVGLSHEEAQELTVAINHKLESKEFWNAAALVENLSQGNREAARHIYLEGRARRGASRIMSSNHYHQFLVRLGFERPHLPDLRPIDFEHFVRMERRVWSAIGVSPHIIDLLERYLRQNKKEIELARAGKLPLASGKIIREARSLRPPEGTSAWDYVLQSNRIAGALTLFSNMGVMFSTRDWSVASTMSTLAGSVGLVAGK